MKYKLLKEAALRELQEQDDTPYRPIDYTYEMEDDAGGDADFLPYRDAVYDWFYEHMRDYDPKDWLDFSQRIDSRGGGRVAWDVSQLDILPETPKGRARAVRFLRELARANVCSSHKLG